MNKAGNPPGAEFLERKLARNLSADVAEFSRLMAENEEDKLRPLCSHGGPATSSWHKIAETAH